MPVASPPKLEHQPASPLVLLLTFGTGGDLQPFLVMAAALQARGHRTLLVAPRFHEATVQATGLAYAAFGTHEQAQQVLDDPALWDERKGFGVVWRGLLPSLNEIHALLVAHAQAGPCSVLCHPFLVPVVAMARAQQPSLRIVCAYLAPSTLRTVHHPLAVGSLNVPAWVPLAWRRALWRAIDRYSIDPDLLPGLNAARAAQGLPPVASFLPHMEAAPDASVGLFPPWYAHRQPDWPASFVEGQFPLRPVPPGQQLPAELEDFLTAGPAPIAFTPGTGHRHAAGYFESAMAVLRSLGRRGLFITPFGEQVPATLPPQVHWVPHAPFELLLPRLAVLVHHGGIGTTAEAMRAGVPQLVVPFAFDQFDNGQRVQRLNAGRVLPAARAIPRRLRREISALLQLRRPGVLPVVEALPQLMDSVEQAISRP